MAEIQQTIGRLPTYKGDWIDGATYRKLHRVTHLGSEFQAKRDGILREPVTVAEDGQTPIFNADDWDVISNGTVAYLLYRSVQKTYIVTAERWEEITSDPQLYAEFCESHQWWAVDVLDEEYNPASEASYDLATKTLSIEGEYNPSTRTLSIEGEYDLTTKTLRI